MAAERVVKTEDGEKLAKVMRDIFKWLCSPQQRRVFTLLMFFPSQEYGVPFMETSAKTGVNVDLAFHAIGK